MSNKPNKADLFIEKKDLYNKADIADDKGFVNSNTDSSVVAKSDGNNVIAAGEYAQFKMDKETGQVIRHSITDTSTTVTKDVYVKDLNINKHKFNNQLINLSDFRDVNGSIIGGIAMDGTVLVKTWEHTLQKWVLIRRPISTPIFSQRLNLATTPEQMEVELKVLEDIRKYYIERDKEKNTK